jgi:XTP/dITP diphosphohydrolase
MKVMKVNLAVATGNRHKLLEIAGLLETGQSGLFSPKDFPGFPEPVEDASTFAGNALIKARALAAHIRTASPDHPFFAADSLWVLADDSGLAVDALEGAPGIHSARYASIEAGVEGNAPDAANNAKLLKALDAVPEDRRSARFICAMALLRLTPDPLPDEDHVFEGSCEGRITRSPSGSHGFGYDPLFIPDGHQQSMAALGDSVKSRISHRARALSQCRDFLKSCHTP